jgi:ribosomal protein S1
MVKTKTKNTDTALYSQLDQFLADSSQKIKQLSKGDIVEGEIVDINNGVVIVDVGYKSEGVVAGRELKSETMDWTTLKKGDKILVYVVKPEDDKGQLVLSIRRTQQASAWLSLENARKNNEVVEAVVVESNNGGLIVEIGKGIRGFIPTSQLDATRVYANGVRQVGKDISSRVQKRLNSLIGEKIRTRIIELDREKNRIILSEKMVTQARDLEKRAQTLKKLRRYVLEVLNQELHHSVSL